MAVNVRSRAGRSNGSCDLVKDLITCCVSCVLCIASAIFLTQCVFFLLPQLVFSPEPPLRGPPALTPTSPVGLLTTDRRPALPSFPLRSLRGTWHLLYRDVERPPGLFERVAPACASSTRELVLLTSDRDQLPMTLNVVAQLTSLGLDHHLLLGRDEQTCARLRKRGRVRSQRQRAAPSPHPPSARPGGLQPPIP